MAGGVWSALGAALTNGMGAFQDQSRFQMQAKRQQDQDLQIKQQRDEDLKRQQMQEELTKFNFLQQLAEARAKTTSGLPEESYGPADVVGGQDAIDTVKSFKPTIPAERLPGMVGLPGLNNGKPEMPKGAPQTFDAPVGGNERPNPLKLNPIVGPSLPSMGVDQGISLPRQTREQQQQLQHQALIEKLMTTPQKVGEGEKVVVPGMGTIAQGAPKPKKFQSEWIEGEGGKRQLANYDPDSGEVNFAKGPNGAVNQAPPPRDPLADELARQRLHDNQVKHDGETADQEELVDGLLDGTLPPSMLTKRTSAYNAVLAGARRKSMETGGKPFNFARAQVEYEAARRFVSSLNGPQPQRFRSLGLSVVNTIDEVKKLSQVMDNSGMQFANKAQMDAYLKLNGNSEQGQLIAKYLGAVNTLKEEFAGLVVGGYAPTIPAFELTNKQINENYGVKAMHASLTELQRLINYRLDAQNSLVPAFGGMYGPNANSPQTAPAGTPPAGAAPAAPPPAVQKWGRDAQGNPVRIQ